MPSIAVSSRSFSKHPILRKILSQRYETVVFNDHPQVLDKNELIHFLRDHDMAIVGLDRLDEEVLAHLPKLKVISRFGAGLDTLDLSAMKRRGIRLSYTAGANRRSVAELVIAQALTMLRHLPTVNSEIKAGRWAQIKGRQLSQQTVGIIGLGAIGKDLALLLKAFDCTLLAYDVQDISSFCETHDIRQVALEKLIQDAGIISVHLPLNDATRLILNAERLALMRPDAILINTARGGLVDEQAVKKMLIRRQLAAAAFDVFDNEPCLDHELIMLPHFFATAHIGGSTEEAILAMGHAAIDGLESAVLPGLPEKEGA